MRHCREESGLLPQCGRRVRAAWSQEVSSVLRSLIQPSQTLSTTVLFCLEPQGSRLHLTEALEQIRFEARRVNRRENLAERF